jgi:hypothetical protein
MQLAYHQLVKEEHRDRQRCPLNSTTTAARISPTLATAMDLTDTGDDI